MAEEHVLRALKDVRNLLADGYCWNKKTYAQTESLEPVEPDDPRATCWCLVGAIERTIPRGHWTLRFDVLGALRAPAADWLRVRGEDTDDYTARDALITFNDNPDTAHFHVLAVIDEAIEKIETKLEPRRNEHA